MIDFTDPLGLEQPSRPIPRWVLAMTSGLVVATVLLTVMSVLTGLGRVTPSTEAVPVEEMHIAFVESSGTGEIRIVEEPTGRVLTVMAEGEGGFMRGILRPLRRERARFGQPLGSPYVLRRLSSGALTLSDASTDLTVDLAAFGPSSVSHFAGLFTHAPNAP